MINLINESDYIADKKYQFCERCTKITIKQFQFCKNIAKNIFIKYP